MHADANSQKSKVDQIFFGWAWSKMGVGQSGLWNKFECISKMNCWN